MHRRRWVVAAASVIAMGAGAALAMSGDDPVDLACDDVLADVPHDDGLPDLSEEERLRIETENLLIQGGEPYTEEDLDREVAEQLAADELFPQPVAELPIEVAESGLADDAAIVNVIVCDP